MSARRAVALATILLAASGCGSTVALRTTINGASVAAAPGSAGPVAAAVTPRQAEAGSEASLPADAPTASRGLVPGNAGTGSVPSAAPSGRAPGVLEVGVVYDHGTDSYAKSFGLGFLSTGDGRSQAQAFINYLNQHGGLAGRRIVPVFAPMETAQASSSGADQAQAAVCSTLTQDNHVALAIGNLAPQASFLQCLHRAHVPYVTSYASLDSQGAAAVAPDLQLPGGWLMDRLVTVEIGRLAATGFLSRSSKVGLMYYDTPERDRVAADVVKPLLRQLGVPLAAEGSVAPTPDGNARFANLVLNFRAANVDRVLEIDTSPLLFMEAADSQKYYPRYEIDSTYGPGAALEGQAPQSQLSGARGIGWEPLSDLAGGDTRSAQSALCRHILDGSGQLSSSPVTTLYQLRFCDSFMAVAAALRGSTGPFDDQVLARALRALGSGYVPAATFRIDVSNGRPDGVSAYRDLAYQDSCRCFSYQSAARPAG